MLKYAVSATAAIGLAAGFAALSSPADAQSNRRGQIIVYGNDPCPRSTDDEVVVCKRVGRTGPQSCSPVGPAGYTGCMEQMIRDAREESDEARQQQTAPQD